MKEIKPKVLCLNCGKQMKRTKIEAYYSDYYNLECQECKNSLTSDINYNLCKVCSNEFVFMRVYGQDEYEKVIKQRSLCLLLCSNIMCPRYKVDRGKDYIGIIGIESIKFVKKDGQWLMYNYEYEEEYMIPDKGIEFLERIINARD